jgi:hypothetical protein
LPQHCTCSKAAVTNSFYFWDILNSFIASNNFSLFLWGRVRL